MIDVTGYPLPKLPPRQWFPHRDLTPASYNATCEWLLPRLHIVVNHAVGTHDEASSCFQQIVKDELAAWITCCWASLAVVTNLGPLPTGRHWAVTTDHMPQELADQLPDVMRGEMRLQAAHYLTAVARGAIALPLEDRDSVRIATLFAILLDALAYSRRPELPQPVSAEPGEWPVLGRKE